MSTTEITNLEQAITESVNTTSIVRVTSNQDITGVMADLGMMDIVEDADYSRENDGTWDVYGTTTTGDEFRLRMTCA